MEPSSEENSSIFSFTKNSIRTIREFFEQNKTSKLSTINDICNCYIIIFGYEYIFNGLFENEFLVFSIEYYKNYAELLNKYNISKEVQNYYADTLDLFTDKKNDSKWNYLKYLNSTPDDFKRNIEEIKMIQKNILYVHCRIRLP